MVLVEDVTDNSENANASNSQNQQNDSTNNTNTNNNSQNGLTLMQFITKDKFAFCLMATRLFTIICTFLFVFPFSGYDQSVLYQKALLSNAATSALRLHQRLSGTRFQLNREYFQLLTSEDSFHYLLFSIIFLNSYPITIVLAPIFLFAVLHVSSYLNQLILGTHNFQFLRNATNSIVSHDKDIMRFAAMNEIILMPCVILMLFSGKGGLFIPFVYYRFACLRYQSRRNRYNKQMFSELRFIIEHYTNQSRCPVIIKNLAQRFIALVCRMAPQ